MRSRSISFLPVLALIASCGDPDAEIKDAVGAQLTDAKSAQFREIRQYGENACGDVNSKTPQGGYSGFKRFIVSKKDGTVVRPDGELTPAAAKMLGPELAGPRIDGHAFDLLFHRLCPESI